jgi:sulfhydrogenase subunit beta (sulfur reductase)
MAPATKPLGWILDRSQAEAWVTELVRAGREVWAPVDRDGARVLAPLGSAADLKLDAGRTRYSPKEAVFPRTETLFSYRTTSAGVTLIDPPPDATERVLFAVHPCDAAGLARLDAVLAADPFYAARRARTTVVTLGCDEPDPECFCTAVGGSPHGTEGSDLEMAVAPAGLLVRPLTPKGEALVAGPSAGWTPAQESDGKQADERGRAAAAAMAQPPLPREWAGVLEASFASPVWNEIGRRCLGCSICAYACPTCSCFDVQDEANGGCGERCRNWDACSFGMFTAHASGHNPRGSQPARYRQRLLHKFSYFPARRHGEWMCVGCGRCVAMCPAGIDIREAMRLVISERGSHV